MKTRQEKNSQIQKEIFREERDKKVQKIVKIIVIVLILILGTLTYGIFIGAKVIDVKEVKVTNNKVPDSFHGIKVVQISDLLYNSLNAKDLKRLEKKVNELKPDILVFTGNLKQKNLSLESEDIKVLENFFKNLDAKISKYAVIGSNDDDSFHVIMENSNFQVLNNESIQLFNNDIVPINVIGFNTTDLKTDLKVSDNYSICILNNPDKIDEIKKKINCNLALAGDTLGGEIQLPFLDVAIFDGHHYSKNYYKLDETEFYISSGLGNNLNIRLFNHPSISLFRITKY